MPVLYAKASSAPIASWLAMRKLPPAPVPYAKALPAPVATWLAMHKVPLSQWGAVRVCLFCFEFSLGRGAKAPSPPQREFEAKKTDAHRMHTAPANSAMFISQISLFCFELSLGRGAAPRCKVCAWSLSLSFSTAHAAAMPLPFDALPRRVTPKLAGYIVSQWCALAALGF